MQFTRQTVGLAGALKKIGGLHEGSKLGERSDAEEVSHMLFGDGVGFSGLFATHPPLLRAHPGAGAVVQAPTTSKRLQAQWMASPPDGLEEDAAPGPGRAERRAVAAGSARFDVTPPMVAAQVAQPRPTITAAPMPSWTAIPDALRDAARRARRGDAAAAGAAARRRRGVRDQQRERDRRAPRRRRRPDARIRIAAQRTAHDCTRCCACRWRRWRSRCCAGDRGRELDAFLDTVHAVVHADGRVSLFEYCLGRLLEMQVRESLDPSRHARFGRRKLRQRAQRDSRPCCAVVAQAGHADQAAAQRAYLAGLQRVLPRDHLPYAPPPEGVLALDGVWDALDALDPLAKQ